MSTPLVGAKFYRKSKALSTENLGLVKKMIQAAQIWANTNLAYIKVFQGCFPSFLPDGDKIQMSEIWAEEKGGKG